MKKNLQCEGLENHAYILIWYVNYRWFGTAEYARIQLILFLESVWYVYYIIFLTIKRDLKWGGEAALSKTHVTDSSDMQKAPGTFVSFSQVLPAHPGILCKLCALLPVETHTSNNFHHTEICSNLHVWHRRPDVSWNCQGTTAMDRDINYFKHYADESQSPGHWVKYDQCKSQFGKTQTRALSFWRQLYTF